MIARPLAATFLAVTLALSAASASAQPGVVGQWASIPNLPTVPRHMMVLPTGEVMFFGGDDASVWDPVSGARTRLNAAGYNIFCSGHAFLPNGHLLITGGHVSNHVGKADASVFDPATRTWVAVPRMNDGRWYPTNTTLPNGDVLVLSGDVDTSVGVNRLPQVWETMGNRWRDLTGAQLALDLYPYMHVLPDGRVFNSGPAATTRYLDPSGTGAWTPGPSRGSAYRGYGSSVMYAPGRIVFMGGGDPPTTETWVIDLTAATPEWRRVGSMATARRQLNATLQPDGRVLVTGGTYGPGFNNADTPAFAAEVWDPTSEQWTTLASATVPRLYHSSAVLLPDGRVLTGGGDGYTQAEVFSPPYLFQGTAPTITTAPTMLWHGRSFGVETPDAETVSRVTLLALSSVTHGFDQNQRFLELSFTRRTGGLDVVAPASGNLAPPGPYLLFFLNTAGVPSIGHIALLGPATGGPVLTLTSLAPDRTAAGGAAFTLTVRGDGFTANSAIQWNGSSRPTTFVGATQLDAAIPAADIATAGTAPVTATDPGAGTPSNALTFTTDPSAPTLTVIRAGTGSGTVLSAPVGIDCGSDCSEAFAPGTPVTLTATPAFGSTFHGWSGGGCTGTAPCILATNTSVTVTATFTAAVPAGPYTLTVTRAGTGFGTVSSDSPGIDCGPDCSEAYPATVLVTLAATPTPGSTFSGWSGACSGTGSCQFVLSANVALTATFTAPTGPPRFTVSGTAATPNPVVRGTSTTIQTSAINTGGAVSGVLVDFEVYNASGAKIHQQITAGQSFAAGEPRPFQWVWPVPAGQAAGTYTVKFGFFTGDWSILYTWVNGAGSVAVQTSGGGGATSTLTVTKNGSGTGTVTSAPAGVSCGADCSEAYASGTVVTLTATASSNSVFTGWSGACAGTGACTVTMSAARSVTATFTRTFALTVTRNGTATSTVTSAPAGVTCGADCTERYVSGTVVALTPTAAAGAVFAGWSGACSGAGACSVTMTADRSVTATFDAAPVPQFTLTGATAGTGAGSVTAPGIACPGDCSQTYDSGTAVALTVTPAAGAVFAGWSGACSGAGACSVDMTADRSVTATFTAQPTGTTYPLTVTRDGTGGGPVTSVPAGVSCGADCTEAYPAGTAVTLGAAPVAGSVFSGWLGACTGTGPCTVTMSASRAVTATFTAQTTGAPRFTADAVAAMPNPAPRGASTAVTATVTNTGGPDAGLLVDFEIYNAAGAKIHQQITTGQSFQSGERRTFRWVWPVPGTLAPGIYTIKLGFFTGNWATLYTWINAAGSIFVP